MTRFKEYFTWRYKKITHFGDWVELDEWDLQEYEHVALKQNECLMRYKTHKMRKGEEHLIKVNPAKQLIYFLISNNEDKVEFETRGIKAKIWLNPEWEWTPREYYQLA